MAKKKGKVRRTRANTEGNISGSGGMPEQYLTPGTPERERLLQAHDEAMAEVPGQQPFGEDGMEAERDTPVAAAYGGSSQGVRNYRNFMQKYAQVDETREIIEEGLGRKVAASDLDDELYDPKVTGKDFKEAAVKDHEEEFVSLRETPMVDTNGDGQVDEEDEPIMTPGMRRMARYL